MNAATARACLLCLLAVLGAAAETPADKKEQDKSPDQLVAPDGIPYDNQQSLDVMQMKPLSANLIPNGSFEHGRYWPYGWEATDGLTTFWVKGGTDGERSLKIYTDVLDAQWKARDLAVRAAVEKAGRNPQSLPASPIPPAPERIPTSPPYYNTVAGLHGVHYRSDYVKCKPGAIYRFSIDARTDGKSAPRVFIKGFFDQRMKTREGYETVRRNAYRAPMILDPCDGQWRRCARLFHPSRSQSTIADEVLKTEYLQVQIYAYWRPNNYYFDNVRLEIVGMEEPEPEKKAEEPETPKEDEEVPELGEDEFPVFDP